jgi:hypothetical protein
MERVWAVMQTKIPAVGGGYTRLGLSMFTSPLTPHKAFPRLKGKAYEVKTALPGLLEACKQFLNPINVTHAIIIAALEASIGMERILDANAQAYVWPEDVSEQYIDHAFTFLLLFHSLSKHFEGLRESGVGGCKLFNVTIKCHFLAHGALMSKYLNPRLCWCYSGEDMMHKMRTLCHSVVTGNKLQSICWMFLRKYRCGMNLKARSAPLKH